MARTMGEATSTEMFLASLDRCEESRLFVASFYNRFMESSDEVRQKFRSTSFDKQGEMLLASLRLSAGAANGDPAALAELSERAETHDREHLDVRPELYDFWLGALLVTVKNYDPEWNESVEEAWRTILGLVISRMAARY